MIKTLLDQQKDHRLILAVNWLKTSYLTKKNSEFSISTASSDASFRRYFRINITESNKSFILMDSPPDKEPLDQFIFISKILTEVGVRPPKIYDKNLKKGFLLLEDFGNETYQKKIASDSNPNNFLIKDAIDTLIKMQKWGIHNKKKLQDIPVYSQKKLVDELQLFIDWYLIKHLNFSISNSLTKEFNQIFKTLCNSALHENQVLVHRDFHSRNLMYVSGKKNPGLLDFQDAVIGPQTYDLASILRDAYTEFDEDFENYWLKYFWFETTKNQMPVAKTYEEFIKNYDFISIQRHLKMLGIFSRLNYRDNKNHYLCNLGAVHNRCFKIASKYESFDNLIKLLK